MLFWEIKPILEMWGKEKYREKKRISKTVYGLDWYPHDGQYSKGKIHCGCGLCKFGKKYGLPTIRDMREKSREYILYDDYKKAQ